MFEQRKSPRYIVSRPVPVAVETDEQRYTGTLHNISSCGMSIRTERHLSVGPHLAAGGDAANGEIMLQNGLRKITGSFARVDANCVSMRFSSGLSAEDLSCLTEACSGTVLWKDGEAHVEGVLGFELRRDILSSAGRKMAINLSRVCRIDSAGIGLLLLAQERGSRIEHCSSEIRSLMHAVRLCAGCSNHLCGKTAMPSRTLAAAST